MKPKQASATAAAKARLFEASGIACNRSCCLCFEKASGGSDAPSVIMLTDAEKKRLNRNDITYSDRCDYFKRMRCEFATEDMPLECRIFPLVISDGGLKIYIDGCELGQRLMTMFNADSHIAVWFIEAARIEVRESGIKRMGSDGYGSRKLKDAVWPPGKMSL